MASSADREQKRLEASLKKIASGSGLQVKVKTPVENTPAPKPAKTQPVVYKPPPKPTLTPEEQAARRADEQRRVQAMKEAAEQERLEKQRREELKAQSQPWNEWYDVGRSGGKNIKKNVANTTPSQYGMQIASKLPAQDVEEAIKGLESAVGPTGDNRPKTSKQKTIKFQVEAVAPEHIENPFNRIDELKVDYIDAEAVRRREQEAEREKRRVEEAQRQANERERQALEDARREEERLRREREERRKQEERDAQRRRDEEARKKQSSPAKSTGYSSSYTSSVDLGLDDFDFTANLDSVIGSIVETPTSRDSAALDRQKQRREEEKRQREIEQEQKRREREDAERDAEYRKDKERRQRREAIEAARRRQEQIERDAEERERRMEEEKRKQQLLSSRKWDSELKMQVQKLLAKLARFDVEDYTAELGMEYVTSIKELSSSLDLVFPLMGEKDVRQIASTMKALVLQSSELVNAARERFENPRDVTASTRFSDLRTSVRSVTVAILQQVEDAVKNQLDQKQDDLNKTQLVTDVREAALDGVKVGELLQEERPDLIELKAVVTSMLQKATDAAGYIKEMDLSSRLLEACKVVMESLKEMERSPGDLANKTGLIVTVGAWLQVLQEVQAKEF